MLNEKQRLIEALLQKSRNYKGEAAHAKSQGFIQEANEYYLRSVTFREAARIVEGCLSDT